MLTVLLRKRGYMLKHIKYTAFTLIVTLVFLTNAKASDTNPHFLILKISEQPQQIIAENETSHDDGTWEETKEVSSDVWDGTKEVSSDIWNGAKKVTGDIWDGAKTVGCDIKDGIADGNDNSVASNNNSKIK